MIAVELHPDPLSGDERVDRLPPYVRPRPGRFGRALTTYWHRPRSAGVFLANRRKGWQRVDRLCVHYWCGGSRSIELPPGKVEEAIRFHFTDTRPDDLLCGSCDGRATAYYEPDSGLVFRPRNHFDTPPWCPARVWPGDGSRQCPLCSSRLTVTRGWNGGDVARHRPTEMGTDPCPDHGWKWIGARDWGLVCSIHGCEWSAQWGWRNP